MNAPESIVVSLEMAKRLKKAGWTQQGAWLYWSEQQTYGPPEERWVLRQPGFGWSCGCVVGMKAETPCSGCGTFPNDCAAATAEDILQRLPREIIHGGKHLLLSAEPNVFHQVGHGWKTYYSTGGGTVEIGSGEHESLANAAAAMWLYLKESKLLQFK
jgi:hypothetical protein